MPVDSSDGKEEAPGGENAGGEVEDAGKGEEAYKEEVASGQAAEAERRELEVEAPGGQAAKSLFVALDRPLAPCARQGAVLPVGSLRFAVLPGTEAHELLTAVTEAFGLCREEASAPEGSGRAPCLVHAKTERKVEALNYESLEDGGIYVLRPSDAEAPRHLVEGLWFGALQAGTLAASGVRSFAVTPAARIAEGGAAAAAAAVRSGTWDLTCGVVGGVGDLLSCTLEGARNTPDALLGRGSEVPLLRTNLRAGERAPQHVVDGLVIGVGAFGRALLGGTWELAAEVSERQERGVAEALKALGQGAVGAPGQLVVGALDTAQSLTTGFLNTPGALSRSWSSACSWLEGKFLGPPFFTRGPVCQFEKPYGWGAGRPLAVPGAGTQSWLFCPLISLGLAEAERELRRGVWSSGTRAPVPAAQAAYWQREAGHIIRAYATWFKWNLHAGPVAEILRSSARWRSNNPGVDTADHLSGEDQERVTPPAVFQALCELMVKLAEWQPPERPTLPADAGLACDLGHKLDTPQAVEQRTICLNCYGSIPAGARSRRCSAGCDYCLCSVCFGGKGASSVDALGAGPPRPTAWAQLSKAVEEIWDAW